MKGSKDSPDNQYIHYSKLYFVEMICGFEANINLY